MLAVAAALLVSLAAAASASAEETIEVTTTQDLKGETCMTLAGPCSLREAIEAVNDGEVSGQVVIEFAVTGTIALTLDGELLIDPDSSVSSVAIVGPGAGQLTIEGNKIDEVFEVRQGDVSFSGLTITHGTAWDTGGGAIYQRSGEVSLEDMVLTENEAVRGAKGGAIYQDDGNLLIADSKISSNKAEDDLAGDGGEGGAIYEDTSSNKTLTIENTEIVDNQAEGAGGGIYQDEGRLTVTRGSRVAQNHSDERGGGIYGDGSGESSATVKGGSEVSLNSATGGGGIFAEVGGSGFTVSNAWISANTAKTESGGGIWFLGAGAVVNSTVSKNTAPSGGEPSGGGIAVGNGTGVITAAIETSTIAENSSGGVVGNKGAIDVRNSTIAANTTTGGSGAGVFSTGVEASLAMTATILSGNEGGFGPSDCAGTIESHGHNIVGTIGGCGWQPAGGDLVGADPWLGPLADNGGPTPTMAPVSRQSAAINTGSQPADSDQRGLTRPVPVGEFNTDIGAVEIQAPVNEAGAPPKIVPSADLEVGETLTCQPGEWDTDTIADPGFSYEWLAGSEPVGSGSTYVLDEADAGAELRCRVTVDNEATTAQATTAGVEMSGPEATLAPAALAFGPWNVNAGPSPSQTLTLHNEGGTDLNVTEVSVSPEFKVTGSDCFEAGGRVIPGSSCTVEVAFEPGSRGGQLGSVTVVSNSLTAPTATLTGTGTKPELAVTPASFDFGAQPVSGGGGPAKAFKVSNAGDGPLKIEEARLGGDDPGDFVLADGCHDTTLAPGGQCTVEVSFDTTHSGEREALLEFDANAAGSAQVSGTGTEPALTLAPPSWDFGVAVIASGPVLKTITVSDTGTAPMRIGKAAISGPGAASFAIVAGHDGCSERTLEPADNCAIEVAFDPTEAGPQSAVLSLPGPVPGSVPLSGTGEAALLPPAPPPPNPGSVPPSATPTSPATFAPNPTASEAPPVLVLKRGQRSGEALKLTLDCHTAQARCEGRVVLRAASGPRATVAAGEVSTMPGTRRVRLFLTPAGYRLLRSQPSVRLEAEVVAYDRATGKPTVRTRTLRIEP